MPGKILHVGHSNAGDIIVDFEPDLPEHAWHAVFTVDEAEQFANVVLKRTQLLREGKADDPEAYRSILVTPSQLMALTSIVGEYVRLAARAGERPEHHAELAAHVAALPVEFWNAADGTTTTLAELLQLLMGVR